MATPIPTRKRSMSPAMRERMSRFELEPRPLPIPNGFRPSNISPHEEAEGAALLASALSKSALTRPFIAGHGADRPESIRSAFRARSMQHATVVTSQLARQSVVTSPSLKASSTSPALKSILSRIGSLEEVTGQDLDDDGSVEPPTQKTADRHHHSDKVAAANQSPPRVKMGLNETVHYAAFGHMEHCRRMKCHAAYASYLVGGTSASDLSARVVSYVYAGACALAAASLASSAGYHLSGTLTLVSCALYASAAATWPAKPPDDAVATYSRPGGPAPRWCFYAKQWLKRARHRIRDASDRAQKAAALRIQRSLRGHSGRTLARGVRQAGRRGASPAKSHAPPADLEQGGGSPEENEDETTSSMCSCMARAAASVQRCGAAAARRLLKALARCPSLAWCLALAVQLAMFAIAALELRSCLEEPPSRATAFWLLFLSSVVPILDTVNLALQRAADLLSAHVPCAVPCVDGLAEAAACLLYATLGPVLSPLLGLLDDCVSALVDHALHSKVLTLFQRGDPSASLLGGLNAALRRSPVCSGLAKTVDAHLRGPFHDYGVVLRGSPLKSLTVIIGLVLTVEKYTGALGAAAGSSGGVIGGVVGDAEVGRHWLRRQLKTIVKGEHDEEGSLADAATEDFQAWALETALAFFEAAAQVPPTPLPPYPLPPEPH